MFISFAIIFLCQIRTAIIVDSTVAYRHYYTGGDLSYANRYLADYLNTIKRSQYVNSFSGSSLNSSLSLIASQEVPYIDSDTKHPHIPGFKAEPVWDVIDFTTSTSTNFEEVTTTEPTTSKRTEATITEGTTDPPLESATIHNIYFTNTNATLSWDITISERGNDSTEQTETDTEFTPEFLSSTIDTFYPKENVCPDGLTIHQTWDKKINCYKIVEPTTFPPLCPYPLHIDYYLFQNTYHTELTNKTVWAFAQRNKYTKDFEWINFAQNSSIINLPASKRKCIVINGTDLIPTNCKEKHYGICIYNFDYSFDDSYCKRRLDKNCFSSTVGMFNRCFCVKTHNFKNQSMNTFCKKLAEPREPYQNDIVAKNLQNDEYCWLGIKQNRWLSDNSTIEYPYWSNQIHRNKKYGAIGTDGWILEDDGKLNCSICEWNVSNSNSVRLDLKTNFTTNYVQLHIYNPIDIYGGVMCSSGNKTLFINFTMSTNEVIIVDLWPYKEVTEDSWCKTLQLPDMKVVFSNKIKGNSNEGNVFAVTWNSAITANTNNNEIACPIIDSDIVKYIELVSVSSFVKENLIEIVCHIHTIPSSYTIVEEYAVLKKAAISIDFVCKSLRSMILCLPTNTTSGSKILHWPKTRVGCTVVPKEICLQANKLPVTRTCLDDKKKGAKWSAVSGLCSEVPLSPATVALEGILHSSSANASKELLNLTKNEDHLDSFEIHLISQILSNMATSEEVDVKDTVSTISNVMNTPPKNLRDSQALLNSTDIILSSLDEILVHLETNSNGYVSEGSDKLLMQATNLLTTGIIGLKLASSDKQGFDTTKLQTLSDYPDENQLKEDLDLALIIPEELRNEILQCTGSKEAPNIITSMFYNDVLFSESENATGKCEGRVMSVLLPGFNCTYVSPIQIIFRANSEENAKRRCASWAYGTNELNQSIHGHWSVEASPKSIGNSSLYQLCEFFHTTHFGLLVLGEDIVISEAHVKALDIITAIGSALSILGLLAIFLTAILFKSYRTTNGVVINFSLAMTGQIVLLFIANSVGDNLTLCTIVGALLHYAVLSQFFWMLTIALLQYQRYVIIFSTPPTHLVKKSCLFAWGVPLAPIIIIISISTKNYGKNYYGLCYAVGNYFIFGVIVPVAIITVVNLIIFIRIMISVSSSRKLKVHQDKPEMGMLQFRLAFMLFFLLGLTWCFGLFSTIGGGVLYSYLFCLTATLQGFVLFLFFIALNEKTRLLWIGITNLWHKKHDYDVTHDSASSMMMRRNRGTSTDSSTDINTNDVVREHKNTSVR